MEKDKRDRKVEYYVSEYLHDITEDMNKELDKGYKIVNMQLTTAKSEYISKHFAIVYYERV